MKLARQSSAAAAAAAGGGGGGGGTSRSPHITSVPSEETCQICLTSCPSSVRNQVSSIEGLPYGRLDVFRL